MTWIVSANCKTKKHLKEVARRTNAGEHIGTYSINDPSIFPSAYKQYYILEEIPEGFNDVVTNHPKRSWFARIKKLNGKLKVE